MPKPEDGEQKKIDRVHRSDIKILRSLQKRERRLVREYRRWRERECDKLGIFPSWANWTAGNVLNRDDPSKPVALDPLPIEIREVARRKDDEIQQTGERFNDCLEKLAEKHGCSVTAINLAEVDAQGKPTGKQLGQIDRTAEVEELESVLEEDEDGKE